MSRPFSYSEDMLVKKKERDSIRPNNLCLLRSISYGLIEEIKDGKGNWY